MGGGQNRSSDLPILEAYEQWDPTTETTEELVERLGISRQWLYQVLKRNHVAPKTRRREVPAPLRGVQVEGPIIEAMADRALAYLFEELAELRHELGEYRVKYGPLDGRRAAAETPEGRP